MPEQKKRKSFLEIQKDEAYENWFGVDQVFIILPVSMLFMFATFLTGYDYFLTKYHTFNTFGCWYFLAAIPVFFIIYIPLVVRMWRLKRKLKKVLVEKTTELKAEKDVAETLKSLDPKTYSIYNSFPLDYGDIDHVIVGPTGIFVVETKSNSGIIELDKNGYLIIGEENIPCEKYRRQAISHGMQLRTILNDLVRETNAYVAILLCFPYAEINKIIELRNKKDKFIIPCLTKEQVVQRIYRTEGSALNVEKILAIKRALDEWEAGMQEEN